jgi:hypothetical protein
MPTPPKLPVPTPEPVVTPSASGIFTPAATTPAATLPVSLPTAPIGTLPIGSIPVGTIPIGTTGTNSPIPLSPTSPSTPAPNTSPTALVTVPNTAGQVTFSLVVTDNLNTRSQPAFATVTIQSAPVAVITATPQTVSPGGAIQLSGANSTSSGTITNYTFSLVPPT